MQGFPAKEAGWDLVWSGLPPKEVYLLRISHGDLRSGVLPFVLCRLHLVFQELTIRHLGFLDRALLAVRGKSIEDKGSFVGG